MRQAHTVRPGFHPLPFRVRFSLCALYFIGASIIRFQDKKVAVAMDLWKTVCISAIMNQIEDSIISEIRKSLFVEEK